MYRRRKIPAKLQEQVRERSNFLCEYCYTSEKWQYVRFTVDHIIPVTRGGADTQENLAFACFHCNRRKGRRVTALDPYSGEEVSLFHPRQHLWGEHFIWSIDRLYLMGLTPVGRATVEALELNRERAIRIRAADLTVGRHPPKDDPVQG